MGSKVPERSILLFLIFASLLSASFAGENRKLLERISMAKVGAGSKDNPADKVAEDEQKIFLGRSRILAVKANNDYGNYDPTPAFSKPPFKLIPN